MMLPVRGESRSAASPVFIDTSYIVALFHPHDKYHGRARAAAALMIQSRAKAVTTEAVLTEVGDTLASSGLRQVAVRILQEMRDDRNLEVLPVDSVLFDAAVALYSERSDKEWGLTDCISFVVMQRRGLSQALTADHHFEQAGFRIVL